MRKSFCWMMLFISMVFCVGIFSIDNAKAEGLLNRNSEPSSLEQQEMDDAFYRGYNDAKSGKGPMDYSAGETESNGEIARGAGRGALGGAAMGSLAGGEAGRGAAW